MSLICSFLCCPGWYPHPVCHWRCNPSTDRSLVGCMGSSSLDSLILSFSSLWSLDSHLCHSLLSLHVVSLSPSLRILLLSWRIDSQLWHSQLVVFVVFAPLLSVHLLLWCSLLSGPSWSRKVQRWGLVVGLSVGFPFCTHIYFCSCGKVQGLHFARKPSIWEPPKSTKAGAPSVFSLAHLDNTESLFPHL